MDQLHKTFKNLTTLISTLKKNIISHFKYKEKSR